MNELPMMAQSTYASSTVDANQVLAQLARLQDHHNQINNFGAQAFPVALPPQQARNPVMTHTPRRLIQVFIADPDENVPLDQCLLYSGEQKLTDLTDQELFFEVDMKSILEAHNAVRKGLVNKSIKERVEYLEAARVRDLKMTVVTIAQF